MGRFSEWLQEHKDPIVKGKPKEEKPGKTTLDHGFRPKNEAELKKFKHADLIVLPNKIEGTNCGNCEYGSEKGIDGILYCRHKDLECWVTDRMCCKYWDHADVKRNWKRGDE